MKTICRTIIVTFLIAQLGATFFLAADIPDGATVLTVFYDGPTRKVLISQENVQSSPFYNKYEGWGGGFDARYDADSLDTAAREFWEEALLERVYGWSLSDTKEYLKTDNVEALIKVARIPKFFPEQGQERPKPIHLYVTLFDKSFVDTMKAKFFDALQSYEPIEKNFRFREKGNLAEVEWSTFVQSIRQARSKVEALVYTKDSAEPKKTTIELRSILMGLLYDHFLKYGEEVVNDHQIYEYICTVPPKN